MRRQQLLGWFFLVITAVDAVATHKAKMSFVERQNLLSRYAFLELEEQTGIKPEFSYWMNFAMAYYRIAFATLIQAFIYWLEKDKDSDKPLDYLELDSGVGLPNLSVSLLELQSKVRQLVFLDDETAAEILMDKAEEAKDECRSMLVEVKKVYKNKMGSANFVMKHGAKLDDTHKTLAQAMSAFKKFEKAEQVLLQDASEDLEVLFDANGKVSIDPRRGEAIRELVGVMDDLEIGGRRIGDMKAQDPLMDEVAFLETAATTTYLILLGIPWFVFIFLWAGTWFCQIGSFFCANSKELNVGTQLQLEEGLSGIFDPSGVDGMSMEELDQVLGQVDASALGLSKKAVVSEMNRYLTSTSTNYDEETSKVFTDAKDVMRKMGKAYDFGVFEKELDMMEHPRPDVGLPGLRDRPEANEPPPPTDGTVAKEMEMNSKPVTPLSASDSALLAFEHMFEGDSTGKKALTAQAAAYASKTGHVANLQAEAEMGTGMTKGKGGKSKTPPTEKTKGYIIRGTFKTSQAWFICFVALRLLIIVHNKTVEANKENEG